jgi:hypothetical protein
MNAAMAIFDSNAVMVAAGEANTSAPCPRSVVVSKTSHGGLPRLVCWKTPEAPTLFNTLRRVLCPRPRSDPVAVRAVQTRPKEAT